MDNFLPSGILSKILKFRHERDWEQFHKPKELATAINIESAELLEQFLWHTQETVEEIKLDERRYNQIKEEIADITIYLMYLINDLNIDIKEAVLDKIVKNTEKYPVEKYKGKF